MELLTMSPGLSVAHYRITVKLGEGGMGEVWRATDTKLDREVAIKILPDTVAQDVDRLARFEREAKVLASLNNPNIAAIYGVEQGAIVMELVEGPTLEDRIVQGPMKLDEVLKIAAKMAEGLEYAHEKGIIHRDLKPANVKITPEGTLKILDFGLAKAADPVKASGDPSISPTLTLAATSMGVIMGTAAYMSPEQAVGKPLDRRTDIWSFGVVLFEMLTGRRLFAGETISHVLANVINGRISLDQLPPELPRHVRGLVQRCLDRDPRTRLRDIGEARVILSTDLADPADVSVKPRRASLPWTLAGTLTAALITCLWVLWLQRATVGEMRQFVIPPPEKSSYSTNLASQAISPDGRMVVFVANSSEGKPLLWLRRLNSLAARPLAPTDGWPTQPFWSPDNKSVAFFSNGKLRRVAVTGGASYPIADAPNPRGGTWNRDGDIIFAPRRLDGLFRVAASGGEVKPVTHLDQSKQEVGHSWPYFLPDGRQFLFYSYGISAVNARLCITSLDSQFIKEVPDVRSPAIYAPPGYLIFMHESTLMAQSFDMGRLSTSGDPVMVAEHLGAMVTSAIYSNVGFSASESGTLVYRPDIAFETHLVWVDRNGKQIGEASPAGVYTNPVLSPDGKRVAFDRITDRADVWLMDLERRITSRFTVQQSNVPVWSPDGRTVAFASSRTKKLDIYQRPANMGGLEQVLLKLDAQPIVYPSDWSADGRYLAYYRTDDITQLDIWVLPLFGDHKPFPYVHGSFNESQGQFSPDGRWMAYVSDESGTQQIYIQSFPGLTGKEQVSTEGGSEPRWRRDGKELFYVAADRKLMSVPVRPGTTFQVEAPRALFETTLPFATQRQNYSVSPDGQRFLLNTPVGTASPAIIVVENWTSGLRK
jgi:serine/threonine protein kinase